MEIDSLLQEAEAARWTAEKAWNWHHSLDWLTGCNFLPSSAINQLEMWQAETFDRAGIDRELGWLAGLGMNSMRVFLHDLLWRQDARGFLARMEEFLAIAHRHGIGIMFVFFDSCWHPFPHVGPQRGPEPGVHNSFWVQSPGLFILPDPKAFDALEDYVTGVVGHFANDTRVHAWDIWNEPDNNNVNTYGPRDYEVKKKAELVLPLMAKAFRWARAVQPSQPLTSGIWMNFDTPAQQGNPLQQFQVAASDVISFHRYTPLKETQEAVEYLLKFGRPLLCTEYLARGEGNTFQDILPLFHRNRIAAYNWGGVSGRSQTIYPWSSWQKPFATEPEPWHHDVLRPDGSPYDPKEAEVLRSLRREAMKTKKS